MKADACFVKAPKCLVFITTLGCTARCRDCCFSASPGKAKERLALREMLEILLHFLKEKDASLGLPTMAVHPCESCLFLFRSPLVRTFLLRHYKEVEKKVVEAFMAGLAVMKLQCRLVPRQKTALKEQAWGKEVSL